TWPPLHAAVAAERLASSRTDQTHTSVRTVAGSTRPAYVGHSGGMDGIEEIEISGDGIRLGQLLKFSGVAESGADAGRIIGAGDVRVDGEVDVRRGRQL